jgi:hypothetical protein
MSKIFLAYHLRYKKHFRPDQKNYIVFVRGEIIVFFKEFRFNTIIRMTEIQKCFEKFLFKHFLCFWHYYGYKAKLVNKLKIL